MDKTNYNTTSYDRINYSSARYADVDRMRNSTARMIGSMPSDKSQDRYNSDMYVDGNTARETAFDYEAEFEDNGFDQYEDEQEVRREESQRTTYRKREKSLSMNAACAFLLAVAAITTLIFCVKYLNVQAEISEKTSYLKTLQGDITTMTTKNDALDYSINSYVDVNNIYKIATEELGMVVAGESQVKLYKSSDLEYMIQYANIPKN